MQLKTLYIKGFRNFKEVTVNFNEHSLMIGANDVGKINLICDVFRRIKKTAKDKLVDLLAHRWQLATVTSWA